MKGAAACLEGALDAQSYRFIPTRKNRACHERNTMSLPSYFRPLLILGLTVAVVDGLWPQSPRAEAQSDLGTLQREIAQVEAQVDQTESATLRQVGATTPGSSQQTIR
jgi:hypothetical protein